MKKLLTRVVGGVLLVVVTRFIVASISPDYSWMGVWRTSGDDQSRALTRQYSYRRFPFRSGGSPVG